MTLNKRIKAGFTLIELLVVVAMIALIIGAVSMSVTQAQERARVQKALSEVKIVSQAILAYENYARGGQFQLEPMERRDADAGSIGFLLGQGANADSGGKIPALLMASLESGGKMKDPWGTPYKVTIRESGANVTMGVGSGTFQTGYYLPNYYRLSEGERK